MSFAKKSVIIYYLKDRFYCTGMVRMPPIGLPAEMLPIFTSQDHNLDDLAKVIESAYLQSDTTYPPNKENLERRGWDGEKGKVWKSAKKLWHIFWEEDNGVSLSLSEPKGKYKGEIEWKSVSGSEKTLQPPVSSQDIAQELLNKVHA